MSKKILICLNAAWNLVNFRAGLIQALVSAGYEVVAVAPSDDYARHLPALGCRYVDFSMDNKGTHPGRDLALFCRFIRLLRKEKPDVYLGYTVKPNVYGSLAAHLLGIPVINNIAGLGAAFMSQGWLNVVVRGLYRLALSRSVAVFFQNDDDRKLFIQDRLVDSVVADRLPGSGVDLARFAPEPLSDQAPLRFLLVARMLWDKGVGDYVEAARILRRRGVNAQFCLLGFLDVQNPAAISRSQMDSWVADGVVDYLGTRDDVRGEIAKAGCVVLPSFYKEGTPRTLLEAAAMARPIVTTDTAGCRDVVDDGINGFLCQPKDANDLADKLARMVALSHEQRAAMGRHSREKAEREFDENIVIRKYLQKIEVVLQGR